MFWQWVVEIGLRVKNRELAQGLDKDGKKLRPIKAKTRKYRRSAMTLAKGRALSGPPLMPARELSRTRSLLAGRATEDAAVFYWRFDPFVGDSWGVVLAYQAKKGRDVVGLSAEGVARVRAEAWERWRLYKAGRYQAAKPIPTVSAAIPQTGTYGMQHATLGIGATSMPQFTPGRSTGGRTWLQIRRELVEPNPTPVAPPGRKPGPYNRYLANVWGQRGTAGQATAKPPRPKPAPKPAARPAASRPAAMMPPPVPAPTPKPGDFQTIDHVREWATATFPAFKAEHFDGGGLPVEAWNALAPQLDQLARIWPKVAARLEWLHDPGIEWEDPENANSIAKADVSRGRFLAFNPRYWSKPLDEIHAVARHAEKVGWQPKGITDLGLYATHEWGHLVEAYLREHRIQTLVEFRKLFVRPDGSFDPSIAAGVSQYAATQEVEAFAETFLAATMQPIGQRPPIVRQFAAMFALIKRP